MTDLFGVSGICNILGAIKMAKYLKLGPDDNVVTVATDGFDRYDSVLTDLERRYLETNHHVMQRWFRDIFMGADTARIHDFRTLEMKERLFAQKERDWLPFGYTREYLDSMKTMDFWDREYERILEIDEAIRKMRYDAFE